MTRQAHRLGGRLVGLLVAAALAASACGGQEQVAPRLAAVPTRTPVLTPTSTASNALPDVTIVSLREPVEDYLAAAQTISPIEWPVLFQQRVFDAVPECIRATYYSDFQPLELLGFNPVEVDNARWQEAVQVFPEEALRQATADTLAQAAGWLPFERPLRVCLLPLPVAAPDATDAEEVNAAALAADLIIVMCAAGDACLERLGGEIAFAYAHAYQIGQGGRVYAEVPLLHLMLYAARAADFARALFPATTFEWDGALTPEQEARLWERMQPYLATTQRDFPGGRSVLRFLWGRANSNDYPLWGGLFIGVQIVAAYRLRHPAVTPADLIALAPEQILEDSGYAPAGSAGQ